jgi:hypothetical protein
MSLVTRLKMTSFLVFGLVACGNSDGAGPSTGQTDSGSDTKGDPQQSCTAPQPALSCQQTQDCGNYPQTVCEQGSCVCPSSDEGPHTADAGAPNTSCEAPQPALRCQQTEDCDNYPDTVCGQSGFCVCPGSDEGPHTSDAGAPNPSCEAPQPALRCQETEDCGNYPDTVCGQSGFCVCP